MTGRGGGWVAAQFALGGVTLLTGLRGPGRSRRWGPRRRGAAWLAVAGLGFAAWGVRALGRSFTPLPVPPEGGELVESGPYRLVRHPVYTGVLVAGAAVPVAGSPVAAVPLAGLAALLRAKARREEEHLTRLHPGYAGYRERTPGMLAPRARRGEP